MNTLSRKKLLSKYFLFIFSTALFLNFQNTAFAQEKFTVVLDAGHGGKDPGKHVKKYNEKDIALNVVLLVGNKLKKNKDVKVVYTRNTDVFIGLKERGKIANDAEANLFVSVHCNAHHTQASGTETYVLGLHANKQNFEVAKQENAVIFMEDNYQEKYAGFDPNSPEAVIGLTLMQEEYLDESLLVASYVQHNFTKKLKRVDRGVKQAGFAVLHQTYMPSVLIETGFITNKSEGDFIGSKIGQEKMASAIYDAIMDYKKHLDENFVTEEKSKPKIEKSIPRVYIDVDFKVQISSSSRKLELKSYNFSGLKGVTRLRQGKHYKYYYGNTSDYDEALRLQKKAKKAGFNSSFIIAYKNDKKVSVADILKSSQK